jgi:hypothetical protein
MGFKGSPAYKMLGNVGTHIVTAALATPIGHRIGQQIGKDSVPDDVVPGKDIKYTNRGEPYTGLVDLNAAEEAIAGEAGGTVGKVAALAASAFIAHHINKRRAQGQNPNLGSQFD